MHILYTVYIIFTDVYCIRDNCTVTDKKIYCIKLDYFIMNYSWITYNNEIYTYVKHACLNTL